VELHLRHHPPRRLPTGCLIKEALIPAIPSPKYASLKGLLS
jgi:hypothetical protein